MAKNANSITLLSSLNLIIMKTVLACALMLFLATTKDHYFTHTVEHEISACVYI